MASKQFSDLTANVGKEIKNTLCHKRAGFFVGLGSAVLTIVQIVLYATSYGSTAYYDSFAVWLCAVGVALFVLASLSHYSSPYAPVVLAVTNFVGFLLFINATYMYLADVFYGGLNATSFAALSKQYIACFLLALLSTIAANVAIYLKQDNVAACDNSADKQNDDACGNKQETAYDN